MDWPRRSSRGCAAALAVLFVSCDRSGDEVARWIDLEIPRPELPVYSPPDVPVPDADGMITKVIKTYPSFFSVPSEVPDPFGDPVDPKPESPRVTSVREVFEKAGIHFGPGSWITADPLRGVIIVRQTPEQMELVEAYMSVCCCVEREIKIRLEVFSLPRTAASKLMMSAAPHTDHGPENRAAIEMIRNGEARLLQTLTLPCRSGQRALIEDGYEFSIGSSEGFGSHDSGATSLNTGVENPGRNGTWMQVDSVLGADQYTIDLTVKLEIHKGGPAELPDRDALVQNPRFPHVTFDFSDALNSGETRLIGGWPVSEGTASDSFCVAFLQAFVNSGQEAYQP